MSTPAPGDVVEYRVVKTTYARGLEMDVKALLKDGWQPLGGASTGFDIGGTVFVQAMVKRAPES